MKQQVRVLRSRVATASSDERSKVRLAFVNSTHRLIVKRVLRPFLEAVAPDSLARFEQPELTERANVKKGAREFVASTNLLYYSLIVVLTDISPMNLSVELSIQNPFSDKHEVLLDSSISEDLNSAFLTEKAKGTANAVVRSVIKEVRAQIASDRKRLDMGLMIARQQTKFLASLLEAFSEQETAK